MRWRERSEPGPMPLLQKSLLSIYADLFTYAA